MLRAKLEEWIRRGAWYFAPFSFFYAIAVYLRNRLYDWHLMPITRVKPIVVSVGNILAGGTGKTPFVLMLAQRFTNRKVAILSRGYGTVPDEAILCQRRLPQIQIHIGKDRAALALSLDVDLIILDDGFQHRRLHRDFDIVLHTGTHAHYLPWGFLRDSPKRLSQAIVIPTQNLKLKVKRILDLKGREIPSIAGWKVDIFCGIANPERFKKTVEELGAEVISATYLADHQPADLSKLPKINPLICTEKDFVKLSPTDLPIYYLEMEMEVVHGKDAWEKLIEIIDQKIDNSSTYERKCKN